MSAIQNLPVRFAIDRAGLVGADGADACRQSFDLTYLATLPNMVVMSAVRRGRSWCNMTYTAAECMTTAPSPFAIRAAAGRGPGSARGSRDAWRSARAAWFGRGQKVAILSLGTRLSEATDGGRRAGSEAA